MRTGISILAATLPAPTLRGTVARGPAVVVVSAAEVLRADRCDAVFANPQGKPRDGQVATAAVVIRVVTAALVAWLAPLLATTPAAAAAEVLSAEARRAFGVGAEVLSRRALEELQLLPACLHREVFQRCNLTDIDAVVTLI
jgi:hypothetical protein